MEWAVWVEWVVWECNPNQVNEFKKGCNFAAFFFAENKHAVEFKINPSFKTLKLLSAKVLPVEVISVIISEENTLKAVKKLHTIFQKAKKTSGQNRKNAKNGLKKSFSFSGKLV